MLRRTFWRGLQTVIPLALTLAIAVWLVMTIEGFFGFWLQKIVGPDHYFPGLGFLLGIALIFCMGIAINAWYIQALHRWGEQLLKKIPVIKTLYSSFSDLMEFFDPVKPKERGRPVLLHRDKGIVVGFVTLEDPDKMPPELQESDLIGVYIPFSCQIGGTTTFVPRDSVTALSMPIEQAMGFVFSAGLAGSKKS